MGVRWGLSRGGPVSRHRGGGWVMELFHWSGFGVVVVVVVVVFVAGTVRVGRGAVRAGRGEVGGAAGRGVLAAATRGTGRHRGVLAFERSEDGLHAVDEGGERLGRAGGREILLYGARGRGRGGWEGEREREEGREGQWGIAWGVHEDLWVSTKYGVQMSRRESGGYARNSRLG